MTRERRSQLVDLELKRAELGHMTLAQLKRTIAAILDIPVENERTKEDHEVPNFS